MRQKDLIIKHVFAFLKGLTYILASKCEFGKLQCANRNKVFYII